MNQAIRQVFVILSACLVLGCQSTAHFASEDLKPAPVSIVIFDESGGASKQFDGITNARYSLLTDRLSFQHGGETYLFENRSWEARY
jgi:hypothetical protein